jgi:UDP-N-acetylmuramate dehydrogenase
VPAAWLIEHMAQCKGVKEEDIGTWPNQPLVIVNYGNASAKDILDFSEKIITKIEAATGIRLEREVNFVG